jgi:hypothetical protein
MQAKYKPVQGSIRQVKKFAWWPMKVACRTIWLRKYLVIQEFRWTQLQGTKGKWVTLSEHLDYWC